MNPLEQEIRALSWKQPFAELMLRDKIETRTWKTPYRGWVLICTSKKAYSEKELSELCHGSQIFSMRYYLKHDRKTPFEGKAIAIGRLVDCRPMTQADEWKSYIKFNPKLYCHFYEEVRAIEPFDWKGSQGWKTLSDEEKAKIKFI